MGGTKTPPTPAGDREGPDLNPLEVLMGELEAVRERLDSIAAALARQRGVQSRLK